MFKVSEDLDSDDDFLEKEFTDDFFSSTIVSNDSPVVSGTTDPRRAGSSECFTSKSSSVQPNGGPPKKSCDGDDINSPRSVCALNGPKSSTPIARGFQPKTKTSPVLLNAGDTDAAHFMTSRVRIPAALRHPPNDPRQSSCANEDRTLYRNSVASSVEVPHLKGPLSSLISPLSSTNSNSVENRNSAFLAEWNDDSFFNAPRGNQNVPSRGVHAHTPEVVTRRMSRAVRQRRFPGPAGLLPPRHGNTSLIAPEEFLNELKSEDSDPAYQETEILSQSSGSVFEGGAWSAMLEDLGASGHCLLKSMNLASIKSIGRNVRSYKVPFLSVLVQTIDASLPDAAVVFKDPTGEMHGVIHRDVWDQFGSDIAVGTVLVLRNVGIISAGVSSRKQVVNITGNNLTAIYSPKDELNIQLRRIHEFAASSSSRLLAEWEKVESLTAHSASPVSGRAQVQPRNSALFNSFQVDGRYPGKLRGADFRPPVRHRHHYPPATTVPRVVAPCSNQRNGLMAASYNHNGGPKDQSINQSNGTRGPMAPNERFNSISQAPSTSSPFSPMLGRQNSLPTSQNSQVSDSNKPKFEPKSPFTMKAPANTRPSPRPPPNTSNSYEKISNPSESHYGPQLTAEAPQACSPSTLSIKKPKLCQNTAPISANCQNLTTSRKNPFQVDSDTSAIDSLLEGIDADSLFGDF